VGLVDGGGGGPGAGSVLQIAARLGKWSGQVADCLAVVSDLIFATKIRSTAEVLGATCLVVASSAALESALTIHNVKLALIDMHVVGVSALEAIRAIKTRNPSARVIAFFSHVQSELMAAAQGAGADDAWPRSKFVQELPGLFKP